MRIYFVAATLIIFTISCNPGERPDEPRPPRYHTTEPGWMDRELIRAFIGGTSNVDPSTTNHEYWVKLKAGGFNTVVHSYYKSTGYLREIDSDARIASRIGIHLIPQLFLYHDLERRIGYDLGLPEAIPVQGQPISELDANMDGFVPRDNFIACPTETLYWEKVMADPAIDIARTSLKRRRTIDGINFNLLLGGRASYRFGSTFQINTKSYQNGTFCDKSFYKFLQSKGYSDQIAKADRMAWLNDNSRKILDEYSDFLTDEMESIFYSIFVRISAINPNLLLSGHPALAYDGYNNWFLNGFYKALGRISNSIALASSYNESPLLESPVRFQTIYKSIGMQEIYGPSNEGWVDKSEINMTKSLSLYSATGPGYFYYSYVKPDDELLTHLKRVNVQYDLGLSAAGGEIFNEETTTASASFDLKPFLMATTPIATLTNHIPGGYQNQTVDAAGYKKLVFTIPDSSNPEVYLLSYDLHFDGNYNLGKIRCVFTPSGGSETKVYSHIVRGKDAVSVDGSPKRFSAFLHFPPNVTTITLWLYGTTEDPLRWLEPAQKTGNAYYENGTLINTTDISWKSILDVIPGTSQVLGALPGQAYELLVHDLLKSENGYVLKAGNMGNIPVRGHAYFKDIEEEQYVLSLPFKNISIKSPSGSRYWTKAELLSGLSVTVMPRSTQWIVISRRQEADVAEDFEQLDYSEVVAVDELIVDNYVNSLTPTIIETHLRAPTSETGNTVPYNALDNPSFENEATSWNMSSNDLIKSEFVTNSGDPLGKELAVDGGFFLKLTSGDSAAQDITLDKQDLTVRGYYRSQSGGSLEIKIKDTDGNLIATTVTKTLLSSGRAWLYFEHDISTTQMGDAVISFSQASGVVELDKLRLY